MNYIVTNVKKRILIVEDEDTLRTTIRDVLKADYTVFEADNGKSARELMVIQDVDLVLADIQMPHLTGIDLLEWSTKHKPTPFIIMTGFSTLLETKSAYDYGAKGFINKPFPLKQLIEMIPPILGIDRSDQAKKPKKKVAQDFFEMSIEQFISKSVIEYDIYIKLSETNFIKIANKSEALPQEQLAQYRKRGVKHLYVDKEEFNKIMQINLDMTKVLKNKTEIPIEKKMAFVKHTGELILEKVYTHGIEEQNVQDASSFIKLTVDYAAQSPSYLGLLNILSSHSDKTYANSVAVGFYSILMAKTLGVTSEQTLFKISMAGLFHDIGKKELDPDLLNTPRHLWTKDQAKVMESHVIRGVEILSSMKGFHSDVVRMVNEHHEDQQKQGYPNATSMHDQHPLSKIIQCANIFVENIESARDQNNPINVKEIIDHMQVIYSNRLDKLCLAALKKIFLVDAAKN